MWGKRFEKLIFNEMSKFFVESESSINIGFKPGDSCINQILSITHYIYKSFDCSYEIRGVSADISKALDKVLHDKF